MKKPVLSVSQLVVLYAVSLEVVRRSVSSENLSDTSAIRFFNQSLLDIVTQLASAAMLTNFANKAISGVGSLFFSAKNVGETADQLSNPVTIVHEYKMPEEVIPVGVSFMKRGVFNERAGAKLLSPNDEALADELIAEQKAYDADIDELMKEVGL